MVGIRAFVGHSFTQDDESVTDKFIKYFDQIKQSLPNFEWTHARGAEPAELAAKVLRLTAECNTFIAICTRKELVGDTSAFSSRWFDSTSLVVSKDKLIWKTSDWIIQEIGLAVGRGMSIIILLEENCRRPGGLQGDVEFIPFNRNELEKSFGRILEMLSSLNPKPTAASPTITEDEATPVVSPAGDQKANDDSPDETWDGDRYENSYFWSLYKKNEEQAEKISAAYLASPHLADATKVAQWKARSESWRIRWGTKGQMSALREVYDANPNNPQIVADYAAALSHFSQNSQAAEIYLEASKLSLDDAAMRRNKIAAIYQLSLDSENDRAFALLDELRESGDNTSATNRALAYCIKSLAQELKDEQLEIEAMECILSIDPDDQDNRFSLAYAHSKYGNEDLALAHYMSIPAASRSASSWNNIGVSYQHFSLPGKSIEAYRKAADESETIAMSNLAYKFMNAGFLDEAASMLEKAMLLEDRHRNVGEAYAALLDQPAKEDKKVEEITKSMKPKAMLYRQLSSAILKPNIKSIASGWIAPGFKIIVSVQGRNFSAQGHYTEKKSAGLGGVLGGTTTSEYVVKFVGTIIGHRIFGEVERKPLKGGPDAIFGSLDQKKKFAIVFNDDLSSADVTEDVASRNPRRYVITPSIGGESIGDEGL